MEAFVCRKPDENHEEFQRFLLRKNARMYAVAFCLDAVGDVYLVGRLPLHVGDCRGGRPDPRRGPRVRRLHLRQRCWSSASPVAIRREWAWREKNGESTANLQAFARFANPDA